MEIHACSLCNFLLRFENTHPRILKCWWIRILIMDIYTSSSTPSISSRNKKFLFPTYLNLSGTTNLMREIRVGLFEFMRRSFWSIFSTAPSNILIYGIVGDSWCRELWFFEISRILVLMIVFDLQNFIALFI